MNPITLMSTIFDHVCNYDEDRIHKLLKTNGKRVLKNLHLKRNLYAKLQTLFGFTNYSEVNLFSQEPELIRFCLAGAMKTKIAFKDNFGTLIDSSLPEMIELSRESYVSSSPDIYCYGRKVVQNDPLIGLKLIASDVTALSPLIVGLHGINCIDFHENGDRSHLMKINESIHSLLNKTVFGMRFNDTDNQFIEELKNCLNRHPTLGVYRNYDSYEVTIAIQNMVTNDRETLDEEFKDTVRNTFSEYGLL